MYYLTKEDLYDVIQQYLLDDSLQLDEARLDSIEKKAVAFAISYISGKYKTDEIFKESEPLRHPILIQLLAQIVVYRSVRRNAARKVPDDYKQIYDESVKTLENIQMGKQKLNGMPEVVKTDPETGATISPVWGNSTNRDNFI